MRETSIWSKAPLATQASSSAGIGKLGAEPARLADRDAADAQRQLRRAVEPDGVGLALRRRLAGPSRRPGGRLASCDPAEERARPPASLPSTGSSTAWVSLPLFGGRRLRRRGRRRAAVGAVEPESPSPPLKRADRDQDDDQRPRATAPPAPDRQRRPRRSGGADCAARPRASGRRLAAGASSAVGLRRGLGGGGSPRARAAVGVPAGRLGGVGVRLRAPRRPLPPPQLGRAPPSPSARTSLDAHALQGGDVLVALVALREQPQHRPLVVAQRHGRGSLCDAAAGRGRVRRAMADDADAACSPTSTP